VQGNADPEAAVDLIGKVARPGGQQLLAAVHVQRQTDDDLIRLPLFKEALNQVPVRSTILRLQRRQRTGGAGDALANRHADAFGAEVKG